MYQCPRCHYQTYHKGNLKNHFFKNKPCSPIYDTIPQRILKEKIKNKNAFKIIESIEPNLNLQNTNENQNLSISNQNLPILNQNLSISNQNINQDISLNNHNNNETKTKYYRCKFCNKNYSTNSHMNRHMKTCKIKIEIEKKEKEEKEKNNENTKLKFHIQQLQEENYRLKAELDKIILNKNNKPNIINNYYTQNTQNNIQNQNNIKINAFRQENTDYLTPEYIMSIARRGMYYAIPKLIEKIYFNENHPENQNVKITNEKSKYGEIFDGKRFVKCAKNLIVKDMICVSIDIIDEVCCDVDMPIAYDQFSKKYDRGDRELMNSLYKKAEGIALTYSKF